MAGVGIVTLKASITGVFQIAKFAVTTFKNMAEIKKELSDVEGSEVVALATQVVVEELPALWEVLKK